MAGVESHSAVWAEPLHDVADHENEVSRDREPEFLMRQVARDGQNCSLVMIARKASSNEIMKMITVGGLRRMQAPRSSPDGSLSAPPPIGQ